MGMDVYGKKSDDEAGRYFRNSVWWWHPLWDYCLLVAPAVAGKVKHGHSNDGDGLGATDSLILAAIVAGELSSGRTKAYADKYEAAREATPRVPCDLCDATGIRTDHVGRVNGMPTKALSAEQRAALGRETGWCNGCNGVGTCEHHDALYPFSVENVEQFAAFLEHCGGFEIR